MQQETCRVQEPRQHTGVDDGGADLQIVCAWCQQPPGRQQAQTPTRFTISYSICARCYGDVLGESVDRTMSMASTPYVPVDRVEGLARHRAENRQGKSFLCFLTEDIQQRAKEICVEARIARQQSQAMRQTYQRARDMRQADQVARAVYRDHIHHIGLAAAAVPKPTVRTARPYAEQLARE